VAEVSDDVHLVMLSDRTDSRKSSADLLTAVMIDTSSATSARTPTVTLNEIDKASRAEGQEIGSVSWAPDCGPQALC